METIEIHKTIEKWPSGIFKIAFFLIWEEKIDEFIADICKNENESI